MVDVAGYQQLEQGYAQQKQQLQQQQQQILQRQQATQQPKALLAGGGLQSFQARQKYQQQLQPQMQQVQKAQQQVGQAEQQLEVQKQEDIAQELTQQQYTEAYNVGYEMGVTGNYNQYFGSDVSPEFKTGLEEGIKAGSGEASRFGGSSTAAMYGTGAEAERVGGRITEAQYQSIIEQSKIPEERVTITSGSGVVYEVPLSQTAQGNFGKIVDPNMITQQQYRNALIISNDPLLNSINAINEGARLGALGKTNVFMSDTGQIITPQTNMSKLYSWGVPSVSGGRETLKTDYKMPTQISEEEIKVNLPSQIAKDYLLGNVNKAIANQVTTGLGVSSGLEWLGQKETKALVPIVQKGLGGISTGLEWLGNKEMDIAKYGTKKVDNISTVKIFRERDNLYNFQAPNQREVLLA